MRRPNEGKKLFGTFAGDEYYRSDGTNFSSGKPEFWSAGPITSQRNYWNFDLAPDGKRLLAFPKALQVEETPPSYHITVLLNFFDELRRKAP